MHARTAPHSQPVPGPGRSAAPSFWGRSARLGGGTGRLIAVSLLLGLLLAALVGAIAHGLAGTSDPADPRQPWVLGLVVGAGALPVMAGLVWVLLVDRETIAGAIRDPAESVESRWYDAAARGVFHDLLVVAGLGTFVVSLTRWSAELSLVGLGLLVFMAADFAVRYLAQKRRG